MWVKSWGKINETFQKYLKKVRSHEKVKQITMPLFEDWIKKTNGWFFADLSSCTTVQDDKCRILPTNNFLKDEEYKRKSSLTLKNVKTVRID